MADLNSTKGDTIWVQITIARLGQPVDLTGAKIWFTVKTSRNDADEDAIFQKGTLNTSLTGIQIDGDPEDGVALVLIDPEDTVGLPSGLQIYEWDAQLVEDDGTTTTVASGRFSFSDDVTDDPS